MRRLLLSLTLALTLSAVGASSALPGVSSAATIVNGGFETGDFTGWTVVNQPEGTGNWFVYSGTTAPESGNSIAAPPEGTHAAVSDQNGPGSHVLYQDVALEAGFKHTLSFDVYYQTEAEAFATPPSLDFEVSPNQQYRVDIMKPTAPVTSVAPGDVLATVFQTNVGDPLTLAPKAVSFDLSSFAGTTVRIRFAEVDNQGRLNASVDNVAVTSTPATLPTLKDQCKKGGWKNFGTMFNSQGECVSFVASDGRSLTGS